MLALLPLAFSNQPLIGLFLWTASATDFHARARLELVLAVGHN